MQRRGLAIAVALLLAATASALAQNAGTGNAGATGGAMGVPGAAGPVKPAAPSDAGSNPNAPVVTLNSNKPGQASEGAGAIGCAQETQPSGMSTDPHGSGSRC